MIPVAPDHARLHLDDRSGPSFLGGFLFICH
jgi:hypothetical protein